MAKALAAIEARGLANIRLHFGDAIFLLDWLPAASLTRVDLLYPDPWPKRRHWKRRFVQDETLAQIARILRPGGEFRFATDIADYAAWTLLHGLRVARASHGPPSAPTIGGCRGRASPRRATKPRRNAKAAMPCYLIFRRRLNGAFSASRRGRPAASARTA